MDQRIKQLSRSKGSIKRMGVSTWFPFPEISEKKRPCTPDLNSVLGVDASSLAVVNRPPTRSKPIYMKVWEARKADGLDYDPDDPRQQQFLSEITKYNIRSID